MTRLVKPLRGKKPTKRLDLTDLRELLRDRRVWTGLGTVYKPEDAEHWEIATDDTGASVDVLVEVILHPSETPVTCRLRAGMWEVPSVGDEVAVMLPEGAFDFMPIIVATLSSNVVPTGAQGVAPGRIVIVCKPGEQVMIHDGSGDAEPLVRRSEFVGHEHPAPTLVGASYGVGTDPTVKTGGADDIDGTSVLLAK